MYPRQQYEMTEEDFQNILDAGKPTVAFWGSGGVPFGNTSQENANAAWKRLGDKMGFVWDSCQPIPGRPGRFFSAVPSETPEIRAAREEREAIQVKRDNIARLEREVEDAKRRLAEALT